MKKISRNWTPQEDKILMTTMSQPQSKKLKWQQVAQLMNKQNSKCQKTGKQCRQRWHNQLAPQLNNSGKWTDQQNNILFELHHSQGNKWAKIAQKLPGRTDNCVKNHFYSTLRRGMRKVNIYIHQARKEKLSLKQFKPDVLTKILIVADGDPQNKLNIKSQAHQLSVKIKKILINISLKQEQAGNDDQEEIKEVIGFIMQFNKNCKKRKGIKKSQKSSATSKSEKKKKKKQDQEEEEEEQSEEDQLKLEEKDKEIQVIKKEECVKTQEKLGKIDIGDNQEEKGIAVLKKGSLDSVGGRSVMKKSSLESIGSVMDFFKNSGYQGFGKLNKSELFDFDNWKKSSGFGIFGDGSGDIQPGEKGMINGDMFLSNDLGLVFEKQGEKSKIFDNLSPGIGSLLRDANIAPSPYTPLCGFGGTGFKNLKPWIPDEEPEQKNE